VDPTHLKRSADRWLATGVVLLLFVSAFARADEPAPTPRHDPQVKQQLDRVVATIIRANDGGDRSSLPDHIARLERLAGGRSALLAELAIYVTRATDDRASTTASILIDHLNFTSTEKIDAVLPNLDGARGALLELFDGLLASVDRPHGGRPDFGHYEPALRRVSEPPVGLVRYMYGASPDEALSTLVGIYISAAAERQSIAQARSAVEAALALEGQHEEVEDPRVAEAVARLETLSLNPAWWVRLYAAQAVARKPALATPEVRASLSADSDPTVRDALGE